MDTLNFLRLYNTATTVYFPLTDKATLDLALSADYTPAAGDAWISIDGGAFAQATNTIAVVSGDKGMWELDITAAELLGKSVCITILDAAGAEIEDQSVVITTYGNASAEIVALPANLIQWLGTAPLALTSQRVNSYVGSMLASVALEIADALLERDMDQVEGAAAIHSLCTAVLKAVSKVEDASGVEKTYETDGSTLKMSRTLTPDATALPIKSATVGT